nr:hypothetical protein N619_00225 [Ipomoea batatas]
MAQVRIVKAFLFAVVLVVFSVAATAQNIGYAPTPSPDAGVAFSLSISSAVIGTPPLGSSCGGVLSLVDGSWSIAAELSSESVSSLSRSASQQLQRMATMAWKDSPVSGNGVPRDGYGGGFSSWRWFSRSPTNQQRRSFSLSVTKQQCGEAPVARQSGGGDAFPLFSPSLLSKLAAGSEVVR